MSDLEAILALKRAYLGTDEDFGLKPYSIRLPLRQSAFIEEIAEENNLSRNEIISNLVKIGLSEFLSALATDNPDVFESLSIEVQERLRDGRIYND